VADPVGVLPRDRRALMIVRVLGSNKMFAMHTFVVVGVHPLLGPPP